MTGRPKRDLYQNLNRAADTVHCVQPRNIRIPHLERIMDALEGEVGEPWLHVVNASPQLSGFLLCLEYSLGALDKQVGRVLALNLWPCGEKF